MELKKNNLPEDLTDDMIEGPKAAVFDDNSHTTVQERKEARATLSNDYSRSSSNTSYAGVAAADYDESIEKNAFQMSAKATKKALSLNEVQKRERNDVILKVSEIITYILLGALIIMMINITRGPVADEYLRTLKLIPFAIGVAIYMIIDAILVCVLDESRIGLFFFAIFLFPLYPIYRTNVTASRVGVGIAASVLTTFAITMLVVNVGQTRSIYGNICSLNDTTARHEAFTLMDQKGYNGKTLGPCILHRVKLSDAKYENTGKKEFLTLSGKGDLNIIESGISSSDKLDTDLKFIRNKETGEYEIYTVTLNGSEVNQVAAKRYMALVLGN